MSQIIFGIIFFVLGYIYSKHRNNEIHKKYVFSTSRLIEFNFYNVLKEFMEMHNIGIRALSLALEKSSENDDEQRQEYLKFIDVYNKKFDEFGNFYMSNMKKIFPYEIKYKTYKEVKEVFDNLINNKKGEK